MPSGDESPGTPTAKNASRVENQAALRGLLHQSDVRDHMLLQPWILLGGYIGSVCVHERELSHVERCVVLLGRLSDETPVSTR